MIITDKSDEEEETNLNLLTKEVPHCSQSHFKSATNESDLSQSSCKLLNSLLIIMVFDIRLLYKIIFLIDGYSGRSEQPTSIEKSCCESQSSEGSLYLGTGRYYESQNVRGSIDVMTEKVVSVLDTCQISYRKSVHLISAIAESLGHNNDELILNKSSFHEKRKKIREEMAKKIKILFGYTQIKAGIVHWDGKIIPDSITCKRIDRLPIIVSSDECEKIIDVPALEDGKGVTIAKAVYKALYDWGLTDSIKALCCDTTAANLGCLNGAAVILEQLLNDSLLYLPCRHHIYEILLAEAFAQKLPGTNGPNVLLFKRFHDSWEEIDKSKYNNGLTDIDPNLLGKVDEVAGFVDTCLKQSLPRDDYKELLLLSKIFLGKSCAKVKFYKPGAYHHARWMAKAIYSIKIYLFREQFQLTCREKCGLLSICLFVIFVYITNWFTAPLAIKAPINDLQFLKKLYDYKNVDQQIAEAILRKIKNHLWYLNPEICTISFFDEEISVGMKLKMLDAVKCNEETTSEIPKRFFINNVDDLENLNDKNLDYFMNSNSLHLLDRFQINRNFLNVDVQEWPQNEDYLKGLKIFKTLRVVNDTAERGVHLTEEYINLLTKDEAQKQYLLQVVSEYKKQYPNANKTTVTKRIKIN